MGDSRVPPAGGYFTPRTPEHEGEDPSILSENDDDDSEGGEGLGLPHLLDGGDDDDSEDGEELGLERLPHDGGVTSSDEDSDAGDDDADDEADDGEADHEAGKPSSLQPGRPSSPCINGFPEVERHMVREAPVYVRGTPVPAPAPVAPGAALAALFGTAPAPVLTPRALPYCGMASCVTDVTSRGALHLHSTFTIEDHLRSYLSKTKTPRASLNFKVYHHKR